jgi:hypothetical protein
MSYNC